MLLVQVEPLTGRAQVRSGNEANSERDKVISSEPFWGSSNAIISALGFWQISMKRANKQRDSLLVAMKPVSGLNSNKFNTQLARKQGYILGANKAQ